MQRDVFLSVSLLIWYFKPVLFNSNNITYFVQVEMALGNDYFILYKCYVINKCN